MSKRVMKRGLICKGKRTTLQKGDTICFHFASCKLTLRRKRASLRVFRDKSSFLTMCGMDHNEAQRMVLLIATSHGFDFEQTEYTGPTVTFRFT